MSLSAPPVASRHSSPEWWKSALKTGSLLCHTIWGVVSFMTLLVTLLGRPRAQFRALRLRTRRALPQKITLLTNTFRFSEQQESWLLQIPRDEATSTSNGAYRVAGFGWTPGRRSASTRAASVARQTAPASSVAACARGHTTRTAV